MTYQLSDMHGTMTYRLAGNDGTATARVLSRIRYGDGTDAPTHPLGEPFKWMLNDKDVSLKLTQDDLDSGNAWPEGGEPAGPGTMYVTVRDSSAETGWDGEGFHPVTVGVIISAACPTCGGPRGAAQGFDNYEAGVSWYTNVWTNPCGHVDAYEAVIAEARAAGTYGHVRRHPWP